MKYSNDSIFQYGKAFPVQLPENFQATDTAYGFEYFTGWENNQLDRSIALLFGNYKTKNPFVYVDYNHNLDFSDDGAHVQFENDSSVTLYFYNSESSNYVFPIHLYYHKYKPKFLPTAKMLYKSMSGGSKTKQVEFEYQLATKRYNNRITKINVKGTQYKVALHDYNCNGKYNDFHDDRLIIGNKDTLN